MEEHTLTLIENPPMENQQPKQDLLNKYGGKTFAPLKPPAGQNEPSEKQEYQALIEYTRAGRNNRFRIVTRNGDSLGFAYAFLIGWVFSPPNLLTLNTTTHTLAIQGRGLEEIDRALLDEKLKELREYAPQTHTLSGDEKIVIERLEVVSRFEEKG